MTMGSRIQLEPAYVLHARAYRETSQLLEIFSAGHGRVGIIANGARRPKSGYRGLLNPFQPLRLSWSGRGELMRLREAEATAPPAGLSGERVLAGFYANELLLRLLHRGDAHTDLFAHYTVLIAGLADESADTERLLRSFEMQLLREIGYELDLRTDCLTDAPIAPDGRYHFQIERGLVPVGADCEDAFVYPGELLLAIADLEFTNEQVRRSAKRLLRSVLDYHLGGRPLRTREVAAAMKR
jgi:DNA repair protein RecO (recombination protein O)